MHIGNRPYTCTICNEKFISRSTLVMHLTTHTKEKKYLILWFLYLCTFNFFLYSRFEYNICGSKTNRLSDLNAHIRIHSGERPFSCEICSKSYQIKHHLTSHIKSHTGTKYSFIKYLKKKPP